jgi:membrane protein required for colicin V production
VTAFDLIALLILLVSAAVGFIRGGAKEVVTVLSFVLAVVIAVLALRFVGPLARRAIHPSLLANAIALVAVFVIAYALLWAGGHTLTGKVREAEVLSGLDRAIGVGFGLVRALVLLGVFYLLISLATPPERAPRWIKSAALYPLSASAGHMLMAIAPKGAAVADKVRPALEKAVKDGASDGLASSSGEDQGYDDRSRRRVDELVEKTQ